MTDDGKKPPASQGTAGVPAVREDDLPEDRPPKPTPSLPPPPLDNPVGTADAQHDPFLPAVGSARRRWGYALAASSVVLFVAIGAFSIIELGDLQPTRGAAGVDYKWFDLARLGAHAIITVALIYFLHRLLQMAERLCLPHWFTRGGEYALLLGQDISPVDRGAKLFADVVKRVVSELLPEIKKAKRRKPASEDDEE